MKSLLKLSVLCLTILAISSCHKEGPGGKSAVTGYVAHHSHKIPNAIVYIKYNATEFPGADVSKYDASVTADANGYYLIKDLYKGDYYVYGFGYDSSIQENVVGGIGVKLKRNETKTTDIPVTEQ